MSDLRIANKVLGDKHPVFIVAELSGNHFHDFDLAAKTIKAAKEAGADAIKLQTVSPETLTINCNNDYFQIKGNTLWDGQTLYDLYSKVFMPWEWHYDLKEIALDLGLIFFSTPVDKTGVDFLEKLGVPAYKVASFEITDLPFIEYIASKNKPIIISTGVATLKDIEDAINTCRRMGNDQIAILKCTSLYPTPLDQLNLKMIPDLKKRFQIVVGLSNHTLELSVPISAVALGANLIENHIILDRKMGGPDAEFSLNPEEFRKMVLEVRKTEKVLGNINYELSDELKKSKMFARSLFIVKDMKNGEKFTDENVKSIRPGYGLHPKEYKKIMGRIAKIDIKRGTPLNWDLIE